MKICEAYCNEYSTARGGSPGDQTGKELRYRDWYDRSDGWDYILVPTNKTKGAKAAAIAKTIVQSKRCGYDRDTRWSLYQELKAKNWVVAEIEYCACDCSSLVITVLIGAGFNLLPTGYTGNLKRLLLASGEFVESDNGNVAGAVYIKAGKHTFMVVDADEEPGEEEQEEEPAADECETIKVIFGSVKIRETPKTGKWIATAHKGDSFELLGTDETTGWYNISKGYITNNPRYVVKNE